MCQTRSMVAALMSVFLAWHNLRVGRGDWRGAIVMGLTVGGSYWLFEVFSVPLHEFTLGSYVDNLSHDNGFAHALMHGVQMLVAYLAAEPYVRRIWPRSLIGWARFAQGRVGDPAVGRELLIGVFVAVAMMTLPYVIGVAADGFEVQSLIRGQPEVIGVLLVDALLAVDAIGGEGHRMRPLVFDDVDEGSSLATHPTGQLDDPGSFARCRPECWRANQ